MALLTVTERQTYLKALGFYTGRVDGLEGIKTTSAYKELQVKYFTRTKDIDGKYGVNTDNLLRSAYACLNSKYFKLQEFKCKCGGKYCTGYPAALDKNLVTGLNSLRNSLGLALTVTSGMRCKKWNSIQRGAAASRHMSGKACDIKGTPTNTAAKRKNVKALWMKQKNARYTYCQEDNSKYKMGNSVHVDVL